MQKILIVEDDADIRSNVVSYLQAVDSTLDVVEASDGITGFSLAATDSSIAMAILDIGLPEMDGIDLCRRLRSIHWQKPILMLTARDTIDDRVRGLESGADDYLIKPFSLAELTARIHAQLRRSQISTPNQLLSTGDLTLNLSTLEVRRAGIELHLNAIELKILTLLMKKSPGIVSRAEITEAVWPGLSPSAETLRSHMYLLRSIIDKPFDVPLLTTVPSFGWSLRDPARHG